MDPRILLIRMQLAQARDIMFRQLNFVILAKKNFYFLKLIPKWGDIDVGDGCWGQNVLVTSLRCWYNDSVTNILNRSPS